MVSEMFNRNCDVKILSNVLSKVLLVYSDVS